MGPFRSHAVAGRRRDRGAWPGATAPAPRIGGAAAAGVVVVTTTVSHRPTEGVEDLDRLHRHNLRLLAAHGVAMVLGTDSHRTVLEEAENLVRLGLDPARVLSLATERTFRWIFPERDIGRLTPGAEASFLPASANVWDSLGDARVAAGQLDRARESYRRALEIDPGAEGTREKLQALSR